MPKGYTTTALVARLLGRSLTADQTAQATAVIDAAEAWIDRRLGRAWLGGAVTNERHGVVGERVYLHNAPVTSIDSVAAYSGFADTPDTLVAGVGYEARDLTRGLLILGDPYLYDEIRVSYTPTAAVPADIQHAATLLVGHWLGPTLGDAPLGVESYSIGDDLQVRRRSDSVPPEVAAILDTYLAPGLVLA